MIKELEIPKSLGFCKKCFRSRREGSAYCGQCQDDPERMTIYLSSEQFPLLDKVILKFGLTFSDLETIIFTYGNVIYAKRELSAGLIAHEITHCFQQFKTGKDEWWKRYLSDDEFRLKQEIEAYRQQYKVYKEINEISAEYYLEKMAKDLSGKIYGNIINLNEAKILINKKGGGLWQKRK